MPRRANRILSLAMIVWAAGCAGEGASPGGFGTGTAGASAGTTERRGVGGHDGHRGASTGRAGTAGASTGTAGTAGDGEPGKAGTAGASTGTAGTAGASTGAAGSGASGSHGAVGRPRWHGYRRVPWGRRYRRGRPAGRAALRARAAPELRTAPVPRALPARARAADVSTPTTVVGTGTAGELHVRRAASRGDEGRRDHLQLRPGERDHCRDRDPRTCPSTRTRSSTAATG